MPVYTTDGCCYFVSYITGPYHIRLGVEWAAGTSYAVVLDRLPPMSSCDHGELSESCIAEAVAAGIDEANRRLGADYQPGRIVYIADDSPRYDLFRHCASLLVLRHAERGYFHRFGD